MQEFQNGMKNIVLFSASKTFCCYCAFMVENLLVDSILKWFVVKNYIYNGFSATLFAFVPFLNEKFGTLSAK